jgi:hypothetical protein
VGRLPARLSRTEVHWEETPETVSVGRGRVWRGSTKARRSMGAAMMLTSAAAEAAREARTRVVYMVADFCRLDEVLEKLKTRRFKVKLF